MTCGEEQDSVMHNASGARPSGAGRGPRRTMGEGRGPYLNPSTSALAHSVGDSRPRRVDHGDEPNKAEIVNGEIHIVGVELEAFGELLIGEHEVAETCGEGGSP